MAFELFIKGDDVIFSEVSPRPHDTGMVTMISQELSEFALHARALAGLPVPEIRFYGPSASRAVVVEGDSNEIVMDCLEKVLEEPGVQMRIFGKPVGSAGVQKDLMALIFYIYGKAPLGCQCALCQIVHQYDCFHFPVPSVFMISIE